MTILDFIKAFFLGLVQGITEWLPISSTGHMILFDEFTQMNVSDAFMQMFRVVIQFGSILAVVILYWNRLFPWAPGVSASERKRTWTLWGRILIAAVPAGVVGILFDDLLDKYLYNHVTVALTLVIYGVVFIVLERVRKNKAPLVDDAASLSVKTAFGIGCFQMLSLIPGTSRSGSTILGAMVLGVSRTAGAEFSFFLAVPVMLGASALKILKYVLEFGLVFTQVEILTLVVGTVVAFVTSLVAIKFLVGFVRRHSFEAFGWYRIALGLVVIGYALLTR